MEAKKSKKAAIENQRGSWLLMGLVVALAFMFVSFEWTQHDVRVAALSPDDESIFVTELVPITFPEEKLEPPPPPETKVTELFEIVENNMEVTDNVSTVSEDMNTVHDVIWIPPVVETETVVEDVIHVSVEVMPEFIGGTAALMKYLSSNIKYPTISQETGSQGKVIVQFVVDKDGTISNPEVVRGVDPYLDKEAIRVISSMPKWTPGFIWLSRFRYRCGYGVHSPFAFSLITDVIYEKMPYYAYSSLKKEQKKMIRERGWTKSSQKVNRFLFRLVNRVQPDTIIEVGRPSSTTLYLQSAKPSASYLFASDLSELFLDADTSVDFLYLNDYRNPGLLEAVFRVCAHRTTPKSVFVVHGICYSKEMKALWKKLQADERVGITFDLYDVGLLFFDKTKIKQQYIVNF